MSAGEVALAAQSNPLPPLPGNEDHPPRPPSPHPPPPTPPQSRQSSHCPSIPTLCALCVPGTLSCGGHHCPVGATSMDSLFRSLQLGLWDLPALLWPWLRGRPLASP